MQDKPNLAMRPVHGITRFARSFSVVGVLMATLFFAISLTPSLLPRAPVLQGVLSGFAFGFGYAMGTALLWIWHFLEFPRMWPRLVLGVKVVAAVFSFGTAALFLRQASEWQNTIRTIFGMELVDSAHPLQVGLIALAVFVVLVLIYKLFMALMGWLATRLERIMPRRLSKIIGIALALTLYFTAIDGVLIRYGLQLADTSFSALDQLIEPEFPAPTDPNKTGSAQSLLGWEELGRRGREFIVAGPTEAELTSYFGTQTMEPVRVYVGLGADEDNQERARLALAELIRVGGFDRSVLVIATPTGTGWLDPESHNPLEYLHRGDIATVAMQYSYFASPISLLFEPGYGAEVSRALFKEVYGYWSELPPETRPRLYLHGLSLGSMSSEQSFRLFEILGDPIQGAVWAGPPFPSPIWNQVTAAREPGSTAWSPVFDDGSFVRFTTKANTMKLADAEWGQMRVAYLQYSSDPIVFFDIKSFYREPDWMKAPRGPDLSPNFQWFPMVTFLQLLVDLMVATSSPMGFGHVYAPEHYIDPWLEVTQPSGWTPAEIEDLKQFFIARRS